MLPLGIGLITAVLLVAIAIWAYKRFAHRPSGREDRYMPERILTPEQTHMLAYLHASFPGQVVLPKVRLNDMLSIRRSGDRRRAQQRLQQTVDFVVCNEDGRPAFAFDVEQYHLSNAKAKGHEVKMKNRVLKTAGVRFVFLKNAIHRMPSPNEFRRQLDLAELPQPKPIDPNLSDSVRQQLEAKMSAYDQHMFPTTGFRESEVMGLSGLMNLGKEGSSATPAQSRPAPQKTSTRSAKTPASVTELPTLRQRA